MFATSALLGQRLLSQGADTVLVWSATRDIAQGSVLTAEDVELVEFGREGDLLDTYVGAAADPSGLVLTRPVLAGELIASAWMSSEGMSGPERSMTIPLTPEHAVGGGLAPGDRIDILATFNSGDARARTSMLARDVEVLGIVESAGLTLSEDAFVGITVGVSLEDATRLAFAIRTAEIDVIKVIRNGPMSSTSAISGRDFP